MPFRYSPLTNIFRHFGDSCPPIKQFNYKAEEGKVSESPKWQKFHDLPFFCTQSIEFIFQGLDKFLERGKVFPKCPNIFFKVEAPIVKKLFVKCQKYINRTSILYSFWYISNPQFTFQTWMFIQHWNISLKICTVSPFFAAHISIDQGLVNFQESKNSNCSILGVLLNSLELMSYLR